MRRIGTLAVMVALLTGVCAVLYAGPTAQEIAKLNNMNSAAKQVGLGTQLGYASQTVVPHFWAGAIGDNVGPGSNGVLLGSLTDNAVGKCFTAAKGLACLACAQDGAVFTGETTPANEVTADDVTLVPATGNVDDAYYFGHATKKFEQVDIVVTTAGNFVGVVTWEYFNGTIWAALAGVTDGTSNFSAGAGTRRVSFTVPTAWALTDVNTVNGYWIRGRISAKTSGGGHLAGQAWVVATDANATITDITTACNSAGAADMVLFPAHPDKGDYVAFGSAARFCKLKITLSTARVAGTVLVEYSKAAGAWSTLPCVDRTTTFSVGTSTYYVSWSPPSDWAPYTWSGSNYYWVRFRISADTVTTVPVGTQAWIANMTTGHGLAIGRIGKFIACQFTAQTISGTTSDSKFMLINLNKGAWVDLTFTKALPICTVAIAAPLQCSIGDEIALAQTQNDGTEFQNVSFYLTYY